jgi:hypothetical protein
MSSAPMPAAQATLVCNTIIEELLPFITASFPNNEAAASLLMQMRTYRGSFFQDTTLAGSWRNALAHRLSAIRTKDVSAISEAINELNMPQLTSIGVPAILDDGDVSEEVKSGIWAILLKATEASVPPALLGPLARSPTPSPTWTSTAS